MLSDAGEQSPVDAVQALMRRGLMGRGPVGRWKVKRGTVTLVPIGQPPAPVLPPEEVEIQGPLFTVDRDTLEIIKRREIMGRHLFAASYEVKHNPALGGRRHGQMRVLVAEPTGAGRWGAFSGCGISDGRPRDSTEPYVSFGQDWSSQKGFTGSGRIFRGTADVAFVRLRVAGGLELEADTEDDISLFFTRDSFAVTAIELCDSSRQVIATQ